jgi:hypothetical protein
VSLAACALGGADGSGDEALPVSGAGPFAKLTGSVIVDPLASISDPAPLELKDRDAGTIRVFFTRGGSSIWRADVPATLADTAGDAVAVLDPTSAEGRAVAPSVVRHGHGMTDRVFLYYETEGGVARATCRDDGASCERDGLVLAGAASPGALVIGERIFLYFTRAGDPRIWVATGTDGLTFTVAPDPALTPSGAGSWDAMGLGDPAPIGGPRQGQTGAAELHVGLYFTGRSAPSGIVAIGYAGSEDGFSFEAALEPVVDAAAPSEEGPGAIVHPDRVVLLFSQDRSGKLAIAAAASP